MRKFSVAAVILFCLVLLLGGFLAIEQKIVAGRTGETYPVISVKNGEVRFFDKKVIQLN